MIICPYCDSENIGGADHCEACGQSLDDLHLPEPATAVERDLLRDRVSALRPKPPIFVAPATPVRDVLNKLLEQGIGCVLVVEDQKLVGIFSERDALMRVGTEIDTLGDKPVSEFMTTSVETLKPTAKLAFAVQRMDVGGFRHVPVVDDGGNPIGIISVRDILSYLTERMLAASE
ncbi:MAG: CBS domain-containing protein [Pirellulaceae bacterium]